MPATTPPNQPAYNLTGQTYSTPARSSTAGAPTAPLRPGPSRAREEGTMWCAPEGGPRATGRPTPPAPAPAVKEHKWTAEDFAAAKGGQLPMGKAADEWAYAE